MSATHQRKAPKGKILKFFLLDAFKSAFQVRHSTHRWTQSGGFSLKPGHFFLKKGHPRPHPPPPIVSYVQACAFPICQSNQKIVLCKLFMICFISTFYQRGHMFNSWHWSRRYVHSHAIATFIATLFHQIQITYIVLVTWVISFCDLS